MLAEKTRDKSVQRPDTCTLLERNENMSRYELNIYEEPIYVYELDRIFANPDELALFLNVDTHDIIRTLMLNTTIRDLHISENRRLRRTRWRPIRIVETGEIFSERKTSRLSNERNPAGHSICYANLGSSFSRCPSRICGGMKHVTSRQEPRSLYL